MNIFSTQKPFLSKKESKQIVTAIAEAEMQTSGEIRVHIDLEIIENIPKHAESVFYLLGMHETKAQNGVLIYINPKIKQYLVLGDRAMHDKVGQVFWDKVSQELGVYFKNKQFEQGLVQTIHQIGQALKLYFPYSRKTDTNELNDDISY